jgi:acetoacetyl-CoA synthetase
MSDKLWQPQHPEQSKMWQFMQFVSQKTGHAFNHYQACYEWSIQYPSLFWPYLCDFLGLQFDTPAYSIVNEYQHFMEAQWFLGARFNFAQKLLSRKDDHLALVSIQERGEKKTFTYKELHLQVAQCIEGLRAMGLAAGDRVAAFLPNTAYTVIAMLATASVGAIWSSCSPDFGAEAALDRLGQIDPKVLFICDGHFYQGKKHSAADKIKQLHGIASLQEAIICPNLQESLDLTHLPKARYWDDFLQPSSQCQFVSLPFNHPLYVLFSSGTTGKPKCILHGAGGTLVQHLKELALHCNLGPEDNLFFYTTCGWMMWNWMVSALALGTTLTLYDGSPTYPENNRLFKLIEKEQVTVFGTSAKYLSTIEKAGLSPKKEADLRHLNCILSTGSPLLPSGFDYVYEHIKNSVQLSSI